MAKTLSKESILQAVADEKLGFKFGKPDRPSESSLACILPILRETSQVRQYITMPETDQVLVTDSGTIYKVNLKNSSKDNVFLRSGTIFEGKGTQSRIITRSAVLFPGMEVALDARCVHASHGIRSGNKFSYGGTVPMDVENAIYGSGFTPRDQHTVWSNVTKTTASMNTRRGVVPAQRRAAGMRSLGIIGRPTPRMDSLIDADRFERSAFSEQAQNTSCFVSEDFSARISNPTANQIGSDDLKANFDAFAKDFASILSKARLHENQVGLALITVSGCKTLELFDVPTSWEVLHKDAVKRMGTELLQGEDKTNVFEYKPENAINAAKKVLALDYKTNLIYEHKPSNGEPHVVINGLTSSRYVGEVVELDGRVIHLVILETTN